MAIATPEGVDLELPLAGLGSRFISAMIDGTLQMALLLAIYFAAIGLAAAFGVTGLGVAIFAASILLVLFGYHVLFETLGAGRTPGKRWTKLRVVRLGGQPVGFRSSAIRNLMRLVDGPGTGWIAGMVAIVVSKRNQRLGDMAAGTLVVRETPVPVQQPWLAQPQAATPGWDAGGGWRAPQSGWQAPGPGWQATPGTGWNPGGEQWDVSAVTAEELVAVRQFLERRWSLQPRARNDIGYQLAEGLRTKVVGAPDGLRGEPFLEQLATIKSARS